MPTQQNVSVAGTTATIIGLVALAGFVGFQLLGDGSIKICRNGSCQAFTKTEYITLKSDMVSVLQAGPPSYEQYLTAIAICDREIKAKGTFRVTGKKSVPDTLIACLNQ